MLLLWLIGANKISMDPEYNVTHKGPFIYDARLKLRISDPLPRDLQNV